MKRLALCIFISIIWFNLFADGVEPNGSGTTDDPYQIEILDNLLWMSTNACSGLYFSQISDIDASDTSNWNNAYGAGFMPMTVVNFNYNGNDFIIDDLYVQTAQNGAGFFTEITSSSIENFRLTNAFISGSAYTGGLAGIAISTTFTNCYFSGTIAGSNSVGGLVGYIHSDSEVINCSSNGNINGAHSVGGIAGYSTSCVISGCISFGEVSSQNNTGGLVGWNYGDIDNSYSFCSVAGGSKVGGLVGDTNYSTISNCYSSGEVTGSTMVGGFIGNCNSSSIFENCFWDLDVSGQTTSAGGTGKTTIEMQDVATYTSLATVGLDEAWDFVDNPFDDTGNEDYWNIDSAINDGYPYLTWSNNYVYNPPENVAVDELTGLVTWDAPGSNVGVYWIDDIDSYTANEYLALQSDEWVTWSGTPGGVDDGYVVDENSFSGSNSLKVEGSSTDLVHEFGSFTSGVYDVSMMMYIESGHGAYYNLLHYYNGSNSEWGMEAYFGSAGTGSLCATAQNITTFNHPVGSWFEVLCIIDLDADWAEYYVDGTFVYEWQWSIDTVGNPGMCEFGATNIWASASSGDTALFYCDDIMITEVTTRELTGYNIYLDDVLQGNTTDLEYQLLNLINGETYVAGVSAVYDEGESEIVEISFIYTGTETEDVVVANTMLKSNYPNPFNPTTIIGYSLPKNIENTELEIYNTKGQLIKSILVSNNNNSISWDGTDNNGKTLSSGIYLYKLNIKDSPVKKMTLMK